MKGSLIKMKYQIQSSILVGATGLALSLLLNPAAANAAERTVNCTRDSSTFSTINAAILASIAGDKITVCPGIYPENVVVNRNNLKIQAEVCGAAKVVPGNAAIPGFQVLGDGNTIKGFAISGFSVGVSVLSPFGGTILLKNIIFDNVTGININNSFNNVVKANIVMDNSGNGIIDVLTLAISQSQENKYLENDIEYNGVNGLFLITTTTPPSTVTRARIIDNTINNNGENGIRLNDTSAVKILDNDLSFNGTDGLELFGVSTNNRIIANHANRNGASITLCGPLLGAGNCTGIRLHSLSVDNTLRQNTAKGNLVWDVQDNSTGTQTAGTGNTWEKNRCKNDSPDGLCENGT